MTGFDQSGKSVLITGSSRGIGLAIAQAFLSAGDRVIISGIDPRETKNARDTLAQKWGNDRVEAVSGNITDAEHASNLIASAIAAFGDLDSAVCNAGIDIIKPAIDYSPDEWDEIVGINLKGAFLAAQAAARYWIAAGRAGSVTMTSSVAARCGIIGLSPYSASKGGIEQMVRTLAVEWAVHGIRVNAVAPGYVENIMHGVTTHEDPEYAERIRALTPLGRRAKLHEVAAPFVFLASDAASYITGAVLVVDGGYSAR